MTSTFLLYGANGFVGEAAARMAVGAGLRPVLAGRDAAKIEKLAAELSLECRVFDLQDPVKVESALKDTTVLLHCAGPYLYTSRPMVDACLRTGTHYLDLTGEIPVYEAVASRDAEARARGVMLLPGAGFDVVPTDCLALHLKQRLPTATHLALAFQSAGPGGLPPGTQRTAIEMINFGDRVRSAGALVAPEQAVKTRTVDFGKGPVQAVRLTWGDVFTAYYS
ncbi:MAG TPA: saccharopine dehydrogenase NADP-binding domain-containing protein, partial [Rhodocyclaceae bacterium]|nr:saccharopine dehydrogenase NADP-binding domain-containing protein [Rhodocyclaceae bacterium]